MQGSTIFTICAVLWCGWAALTAWVCRKEIAILVRFLEDESIPRKETQVSIEERAVFSMLLLASYLLMLSALLLLEELQVLALMFGAVLPLHAAEYGRKLLRVSHTLVALMMFLGLLGRLPL